MAHHSSIYKLTARAIRASGFKRPNPLHGERVGVFDMHSQNCDGLILEPSGI
jgi:hypothetical protein